MSKTDITKNALAQSLKELMRTTPFAKISVEKICERSGISRRNFYRHFPDKYELLNWMYYVDFAQGSIAQPEKRSLDKLPRICEHLYRDRAVYLNAFDVKGQNSFRSFCIELLWPDMVRDYGRAFLTEKEERFYLNLILNAVFDTFQMWLRSEPCRPPEEFARKLIASITRFAKVFAEVAES